MGVTLSEANITDFESCVHRELLTYVKYPFRDTSSRCFAYPQYLVGNGTLSQLEDSAFPDNGCLPMVVSGTSTSELEARYGSIVVMTLNDDSPNENRNYGHGEDARYNSIIDPTWQKGRSSVEFASFSRHQLSSELMQVLEIQESIDLSKPPTHPIHLYSGDAAPQTNLALVAQTKNGRRKYYGPFECSCSGDAVVLSASSAFDMSIAGFNETSFRFATDLVDEGKNAVARFVSADEFAEKFAGSDEVIDWIGDEELLDAIGRVSRAGTEALSKSQMRSLKAAISKCLDEAAKIKLTPQRRAKMLSLLSAYEDWSSLPSEVKSDAIDQANPEQLAEYVLSNEHFSAFYDKVIEVEQIRSKVEQEKAHYREQTAAAQQAAEEAEARKSAALLELETYERELEAKRQKLEKEVAEKTELARRNRDALASEVSQLAAKKRELEEGKSLIEHQIRSTIANMSDELSVSSKILESEIIKHIVSSIGENAAEDRSAAKKASATPAPSVIVSGEESLSGATLLDRIEKSICELGGRDLNRNEVANLMICLTQGYILTFAGQPGTGKTSLASIIAGALGLSNRKAKRFTEISVERGWTSYKDFIGYYNPLTKTMEKSNPLTFDAFASLNEESRRGLGLETVSPHLFLLDEANLSSIEHYWSPFLRACDSFRNGPFDLSLGGDEGLVVPEYVRFIATVNFDHTTEELSPRFLDRSWTITLDPDTFDLEGDDLPFSSHDFGNAPAYSMAKMQEVFGARRGAIMRVELKSKIKEVLDLCAKHRCPVSHRSQKMVWNYVCTADEIMDRSTAQTAYAPVDYAVTQKILPLLSGSEKGIEDLLHDLAGVNGLPEMKARVDHMLEVGNDCGYYQYFA